MRELFSLANWAVSALMWVLAIFLFIPHGIQSYYKWKKTNRPLDLSGAIALWAGAFFLLSAAYVRFIKIFIYGALP